MTDGQKQKELIDLKIKWNDAISNYDYFTADKIGKEYDKLQKELADEQRCAI